MLSDFASVIIIKQYNYFIIVVFLLFLQHQMRKRVKAYVEQPYTITDEGHLDVLFKI